LVTFLFVSLSKISAVKISNKSELNPKLVYKLLYPHIKNVVSLNTFSRMPNIGLFALFEKSMNLTTSQTLEFIGKRLETWTPEMINPELFIKNNGLDILKFPYSFRDDGLQYWRIIKNYVQEIIENTYKNGIQNGKL